MINRYFLFKSPQLILILGASLLSLNLVAQAPLAETPKVDHSYKPLTLKLSDDGNKYIRFIIWNQMWARYTQNNPGTKDFDGNASGSSIDIGARRLRFLAYAQISPRFLILTHWGINNQTFLNGGANGLDGKKPQLFIHDAWNEYAVVPNKFHVGMGLHYWNGPTRMASTSTLNFMTLDAPVNNWTSIEQGDQFARKFGFYAKGQVGLLDYRISINKPFANGVALASITPTATSATLIKTNTWETEGYFQVMLKEKENNKLPFTVGSYLGGKEVLNIGLGHYFQPDAVALGNGTTVEKKAIFHLAADVYYEKPLNKEKGTYFHLYSSLTNLNYGPNYTRSVGIMNINPSASSTDSYAGGGNAQILLGTGQLWYTQFGYGMPKQSWGQLMPYATYTLKNFEGLKGITNQFDLGLNYFVNGHNAKFTLQYSMRPVINGDATSADFKKQTGMAGELILQSHFFL